MRTRTRVCVCVCVCTVINVINVAVFFPADPSKLVKSAAIK